MVPGDIKDFQAEEFQFDSFTIKCPQKHVDDTIAEFAKAACVIRDIG